MGRGSTGPPKRSPAGSIDTAGLVSDVHHCAAARPGHSYHNPYDVAGALDRLRAALDWFAREHVAAVILDGDLTDLGDARSLTEVIEAVATAWDGPAIVVPGNHDARGRPDALLGAVREAGRGCVEIGPNREQVWARASRRRRPHRS